MSPPKVRVRADSMSVRRDSNPRLTEAQLFELIRETCKWKHILCYHTHDSRRSGAGFPDLVLVGANGLLSRS